MSDLVPQALDRLVEELRRYAAYQLEYGGADKRSDDVRLMSRAANRIEALEADLKSALREVSRYAAEAGDAKGRLEMSEAAGIVKATARAALLRLGVSPI